IGSTIGSGIVLFPAEVAGYLSSPTPFLAVWAVGGLLVLCGALGLAELGSAYPEAGGIYGFIREGWGRPLAFLFGWGELTAIRPAAIGIHAVTFAKYLVNILEELGLVLSKQYSETMIASGAIILAATFNYRGVRLAAAVNRTTTVARLGGIAAIIVI